MDIVIVCLQPGAHHRHDGVIGVSVNFRAIAIQRTLRESGNQGREPSRAAEDVIAELEGTDVVDGIAFHQDLLKACFAEPIVSKLKMITEISNGRVKHRLIMNC